MANKSWYDYRNEVEAELQRMKRELKQSQQQISTSFERSSDNLPTNESNCQLSEGAAFVTVGALASASYAANIGGMGLVGGFGGIGLGIAPITAAGAISGAAIYGAFEGMRTADPRAVNALAIGALGGAGVSAAVGGMGLSLGGSAMSLGMGAMAAAGGIVGLGMYGLYKITHSSNSQAKFDRNWDCLQAITWEYEEKRFWDNLEIEEELQALKSQTRNHLSTEF